MDIKNNTKFAIHAAALALAIVTSTIIITALTIAGVLAFMPFVDKVPDWDAIFTGKSEHLTLIAVATWTGSVLGLWRGFHDILTKLKLGKDNTVYTRY